MTDTFSCQDPNDFALRFNRMVSMSKKVSLKWQLDRVGAQWVDCLCSTYRGLGSIAAPHQNVSLHPGAVVGESCNMSGDGLFVGGFSVLLSFPSCLAPKKIITHRSP